MEKKKSKRFAHIRMVSVLGVNPAQYLVFYNGGRCYCRRFKGEPHGIHADYIRFATRVETLAYTVRYYCE